MNKILMDGDILKLDSNIEVTVNGKATIYIYDFNDNIDLKINMLDNSELLILDFNLDDKETKIRVNQANNTNLNYIHTFKITGNYTFDYLAEINGNNNINNININGITSGYVNLIIDAIAKKNTKNNELNENIKVLNLGGKVKSEPKLHINCLEVIANHNTAISNIREDELFYLNSKGISLVGAIRLIEDGYLYGILKKYEEFYKLVR